MRYRRRKTLTPKERFGDNMPPTYNERSRGFTANYKTCIKLLESQTVSRFPEKQHDTTIGMKGVYLLLVSTAVLAIFADMEDELLWRPSDNNQFLKSRMNKRVCG
jgi:hypothetical protein